MAKIHRQVELKEVLKSLGLAGICLLLIVAGILLSNFGESLQKGAEYKSITTINMGSVIFTRQWWTSDLKLEYLIGWVFEYGGIAASIILLIAAIFVLKETFEYIFTGKSLPLYTTIPGNGESVLDVTPELIWEPRKGAMNYHLQIATDKRFDTLIIDEKQSIDNRYQVSPETLKYKERYYWRVYACTDEKTIQLFERSFKTTETSDTKALMLPEDNQRISSLTPKLTWETYTGDSKYHLQIATDIRFKTILIDEKELGHQCLYIVPPNTLKYNTQYYWRVDALMDKGTVRLLSRTFFTPVA